MFTQTPQLSSKRHIGWRLLVGGCAVFVAAASGAFGHGGYHQRMEELAAEVTKNPTDPRLYLELADLNTQHGDWQISLLNLDRVEELAPGQFPTNLFRGQAWLEGKQLEKARKALDAAVKANPDAPRGWILRGRTCKAMGDIPASAADFREALKRTPQPEPDLYLEAAEALVAAGASAEAEQVLVAGIAKVGAVPSLVFRSMEIEIAAGNFDAALQRVAAMQASAPRPEPWMARRASVLAQAGRIEESRAAWQALAKHLIALPNLERGSHAMSKLMEEAQQALAALASANPPTPAARSTPATP